MEAIHKDQGDSFWCFDKKPPLSYFVPSGILEYILWVRHWAENSVDKRDKILALMELTF